MDLIDEKDDFSGGSHYFVDDAFESLLKLTLVLRTRNKCTHIEGVDLFLFQVFGHIATYDTMGEAFRDGSLTDTRFADENRVVLRTAAQDLEHPPDLVITTDDWV